MGRVALQTAKLNLNDDLHKQVLADEFVIHLE
jgi:hypothetical protein